MATHSEIRQTKRDGLTLLKQTKKLGGTLDDAIAAQEASMEADDVELVDRKFKTDAVSTS